VCLKIKTHECIEITEAMFSKTRGPLPFLLIMPSALYANLPNPPFSPIYMQVKGSWGTKVEAVVRRLAAITMSDPEARVGRVKHAEVGWVAGMRFSDGNDGSRCMMPDQLLGWGGWGRYRVIEMMEAGAQ
jgi:hypothetical protein